MHRWSEMSPGLTRRTSRSRSPAPAPMIKGCTLRKHPDPAPHFSSGLVSPLDPTASRPLAGLFDGYVLTTNQFIQGQGLDLVIEELVQRRGDSGLSASGELADARADRTSSVVRSPSFFPELGVAGTLADASCPAGGSGGLSRMAHSLLTGQFVDEEATSVVAEGAAPAPAGGSKEALGRKFRPRCDRGIRSGRSIAGS